MNNGERNFIGKLFLLFIIVFFIFKMADSSGPQQARAVGQYGETPEHRAAVDIVKNLERYQAPTPYKCKTTSWDGPYKHDGRTYSTTCN